MLVSKNRCKSCKEYPGHRFCLRKDKHICWKCCNQMRSDLKCPDECEYRLRKKHGEVSYLQFESKVDSKTEYAELFKYVADYWMQHEVTELDSQLPILMSQTEDGRIELEKYFSKYQFPLLISDYLKQRLKVKVPCDQKDEAIHYEQFAIAYMNHLLSGDWDKVLAMYEPAIHAKENGLTSKFIEHFKGQSTFRKMNNYDLLSAGMSARTKEAFVTFEINKNRDFTVILMPYEDSWIVTRQIFGSISLVTSENEGIRFIATAIAQKELDKAYRYLINYIQVYYFSSDLYYYQGLYYTMKGDNKHAREAYQTSITLDPSLIESQYNLAYIAQSENSLEEAKTLYLKILKDYPDYINALNNLGTIYLFEKNYQEAESCFNKCLSVNPDFEYAKNNLEKLQELKN